MCGNNSELFEVKVVPAKAKVFSNVSNDSARHVARMPGKGDETVQMKRIRVMPMTAGSADKLASNLL
jgi:hypothetical protein